MYNPIAEIPKLKYPNAHVEAKKVEALEVAVANAGLGPDAVVIHFVLAFFAGAAVMDSGEFVVLAWTTVFVGGGVGVIVEFIQGRGVDLVYF